MLAIVGAGFAALVWVVDRMFRISVQGHIVLFAPLAVILVALLVYGYRLGQENRGCGAHPRVSEYLWPLATLLIPAAMVLGVLVVLWYLQSTAQLQVALLALVPLVAASMYLFRVLNRALQAGAESSSESAKIELFRRRSRVAVLVLIPASAGAFSLIFVAIGRLMEAGLLAGIAVGTAVWSLRRVRLG